MATTTEWEERQSNPHIISGIATIDANETATLPIPCHGRGVVRLGFPTMTGTAATFTVQPFAPADPASPTANPPFRSLVKADGTAVSITVTSNSVVEIPQLSGCYSFTIVSGSSEASAREIEVTMVGDPAPFEPSEGGVVPGDFAAPALTLGTSNAAGNTGKVLATNSTILAFDATVPTTIASGAAAAAGSATVAARRDHTHGAPTLAPVPVFKWTDATQTVNASTTYVDVVAVGSPATMTFTPVNGGIYRVEYDLPMTFTGTGGAKFQITGGTVTAVSIRGTAPTSDAASEAIFNWQAAATAFSADIYAKNAGVLASGAVNFVSNVNGGNVSIIAYVASTSTTDITLQYAQNSANGTSVIGVGGMMRAEKMN